MRKKDIVDHLYVEFHGMRLSKFQLKLIVDEIFTHMIKLILTGKVLKIRQFGSFSFKDISDREIYIPVKKKKILIKNRSTVKFIPSSIFKKKT